MKDLKALLFYLIIATTMFIAAIVIYNTVSQKNMANNLRETMSSLLGADKIYRNIEPSVKIVHPTDGGTYSFPYLNASTAITSFTSENDVSSNGASAHLTFGVGFDTVSLTAGSGVTLSGAQWSINTKTPVFQNWSSGGSIKYEGLSKDGAGLAPLVNPSESVLQEQLLLSLFSLQGSLLEPFIRDNSQTSAGGVNLASGLTNKKLFEAIVGERGSTVDDRFEAPSANQFNGMIGIKPIDLNVIKELQGTAIADKYKDYRFGVIKKVVSKEEMKDKFAKVLFGKTDYKTASAQEKIVIDDAVIGMATNLAVNDPVVIPYRQRDIIKGDHNLGLFSMSELYIRTK